MAEQAVFQLQHPKQRNFTGFKGTYQFINGKHTYVGTRDMVAKRAYVLGRFYGAKRVGGGTSQVDQDDQHRGPDPVSSDVQPEGQGPTALSPDERAGTDEDRSASEGSVPGGDGHSDAGYDGSTANQDRIREAVNTLDATNDEHWTADGRPRMDAVERAFGSAGITRADVEAAVPGYTRDTAAE